jgi:hypothetical protein
LERGYLRLTFEEVAGNFVVPDDKMPESDVSPWKTPGNHMLDELFEYPFLETFEGVDRPTLFTLGCGFVMCDLGLLEDSNGIVANSFFEPKPFPPDVFSRKPPVIREFDPASSNERKRKTFPKLEIQRLAEILHDRELTSLIYKYHFKEGGCVRVRSA